MALNNIAESTQKWESVAKKGGNYFKNLAAKDHAKWFASPAQQVCLFILSIFSFFVKNEESKLI